MEIKCRGGRRRAPAPFPPAMVYFVLYAIAEIILPDWGVTPADKSDKSMAAQICVCSGDKWKY